MNSKLRPNEIKGFIESLIANDAALISFVLGSLVKRTEFIAEEEKNELKSLFEKIKQFLMTLPAGVAST